jgi:hypothetical protein
VTSAERAKQAARIRATAERGTPYMPWQDGYMADNEFTRAYRKWRTERIAALQREALSPDKGKAA